MSAMSPADVLRKAAALMRERAVACADFDAHGPWVARGQEVVRLETEGPRNVMIAREGAVGWRSHAYEVSATHIASWHPAVALAVADWLDEVAWRSEHVPKQYRGAKQALAVARAYLGATP